MIGHWVKVVQPVQFQKGYNDLVLLSQTVGLQVTGLILLSKFEYHLRFMPSNCSTCFKMLKKVKLAYHESIIQLSGKLPNSTFPNPRIFYTSFEC